MSRRSGLFKSTVVCPPPEIHAGLESRVWKRTVTWEMPVVKCGDKSRIQSRMDSVITVLVSRVKIARTNHVHSLSLYSGTRLIPPPPTSLLLSSFLEGP